MLSRQDRFQYNVATGRSTLPVVIFITLVLWLIPMAFLSTSLRALLCCGAATYLLIEMDIRFALMRVRTALPSCLFLLLYAVVPQLHEWSVSCFMAPLFVLMLFSLLQSYESNTAPTSIFHAFLCLGLMGLIVPCMVWIAPLVFLHTFSLRSSGARTFLAGLIGLSLPYWFMYCYGLYIDDTEWFFPYLTRLVQPVSPGYTLLSAEHFVIFGVVALMYIVYSIHYWQSDYKDKVQTRTSLHVVFWMGVWAFILALIQPVYLYALLPVIFVPTAILGGHLFALTFSRSVRIVFYATIILLAAIPFYCLWMLFSPA